MTREVSIWQIVGDSVKRVALSGIDLEQRLQDILAKDISVLDQQLLVIGREVQAGTSGRIDLLAIDPEGYLVVIELKRERTPRDVVAQALDYASWVDRWGAEEIQRTFLDYQRKYLQSSSPLLVDDALRKQFDFTPDELNLSHRLVIVASEIDPATERIIGYLQERHSVPISFEVFHAFEDGGREFLIRSHQENQDPFETDGTASSSGEREWNGEYYANFGEYSERPWSNGKEYGFLRAGGGARFQRFLERLPVGGRVWVNVPRKGYVGVGHVTAEAVPYREFMVEVDGTQRPLSEIESDLLPAEDEYVVAVKWQRAVDIHEAVRARGLFGNQNTVAQPRDPSWQLTVDVLAETWGLK